MCREYKPTVTLNGVQKKQLVRCYIAVPPLTAEPVLQPGQCWWQTLPPTRTRESNRSKRVRKLSEEDISDVTNIDANLPEPVQIQTEEKMEIDLTTDPWDNKRVRKLFLPVENEHPKDAIARRIDILMEARTSPDGYKSIIQGGDEHNNCTKKDIIKLNDKCIYLISALTAALNSFPKKSWRDCCEESSKICHVLTTAYTGRTVEIGGLHSDNKIRFHIRMA